MSVLGEFLKKKIKGSPEEVSKGIFGRFYDKLPKKILKQSINRVMFKWNPWKNFL